MHKISKLLCFVVIAYIIQIAASSCSSKNIKFYEELKCSRARKNIGSDCPLEYNCTNFFKRPMDKCFFQGILYGNDETIENEEFLRVSDKECRCSVDDRLARRVCMYIDCMEFFTEWPHEGCRKSYKTLNQHCSGEICYPFTGLAQCVVGNKTYFEGEKFRPDNCSSCLCTTTGLKCQEQSCFVEDFNLVKLVQRCAPVYQPTRCCPSEWACYEKTDLIIDVRPSLQQGPKCLYGNETVSKKGMMIKPLKPTGGIICSCIVPPFLECRRATRIYN